MIQIILFIMAQKAILVVGIFFAFLAVAAGAFGAHYLRTRMSADALVVFETAVRYQMYHALALIALACCPFTHPLIPLAGWILAAGIVLFSGSLYLRYFPFTPVGGLILLLGWLIFALGVIKS